MGATLFANPELSRPPQRASQSVTVEIGGIPILLQPNDPKFCEVLEDRYAGFLSPDSDPACQFEIQLDPKGRPSDEDARVTRQGTLWSFQRGDFRATWDARAGRGHIRQCPNPYSIDTVLRITHSLVLAEEGGFLVHAASAIRNERAYLFAGVSGAGKTTMARLAPPDATVLTDEISYVRRIGITQLQSLRHSLRRRIGPRRRQHFRAARNSLSAGARPGKPHSAPSPKIDAARALMRHVLFFAEEKEMVARVFDSVLEFVSHIEVAQLVFTPDARAWELIR